MDTDLQPAFHVHTADGSGYTIFAEHVSGLYLHDACTRISYPTTVAKTTSPSIIGYSYLQTVATNKLSYTKRQIDTADKARELYRKIGHPGPHVSLMLSNKILLLTVLSQLTMLTKPNEYTEKTLLT
jgi:hypothetical protein